MTNGLERWPLSLPLRLMWTGKFAPQESRAAFVVTLADDLLLKETVGVEDSLQHGWSAARHPLHDHPDEQTYKKVVWYNASRSDKVGLQFVYYCGLRVTPTGLHLVSGCDHVETSVALQLVHGWGL